MKTIKPLRLAALHRVIELSRQPRFVITSMACFALDEPRTLHTEMALWQLVEKEPGLGYIIDEGMPKARGELLVTGTAYVRGEEPMLACEARVRVGPIDKRLWVVGDRRWGLGGASDPEPFRSMPIDWQHAYGGPDWPANPLGKGHAPVDGVHALPNVETPGRLVKSPRDRPEPAGFGPLDVAWRSRQERAGTYDAAWLEEQYPSLAGDTDPTFFQRAPAGQWCEGYWQGGEAFRVENMHPTTPVVEGHLPRLRARAFVTVRERSAADEGEEDTVERTWREVAMRLDTVHLFPHHMLGVLVFRGVTDIAEDDADDVEQMLLAFEDGPTDDAAEGDGDKGLEHYRTVLAQRTDRERGHLYSLRDGDLLPAHYGTVAMTAAFPELTAALEREGLMEANLRRRAERQLAEAREICVAHGLDPDDHVPRELPPDEPVPPLDELAEYVDDKMAEGEAQRAEAESKLAAAEADARAQCAAQGLDYDAIVGSEAAGQGGPPAFRAAEHAEFLRGQLELASRAGVDLPEVERQLLDPELMSRLQRLEDTLFDTYRRAAHHLPEPTVSADEALRRGTLLRAALEAGEPMGRRDLSGADLRGVDLRGLDLSGALLEKADLRGADLSVARLDDAVLTRADLRGAVLDGTRLRGANLGGACLDGANLATADLRDAVLGKASLVGACLAGTELDGADFLEAVLTDADLRGAKAERLLVYRAKLGGVRLEGAELRSCTFLECDLDGLDARGAVLSSSTLVTCTARGARLDGARADNLRVVHGSDLTGAHLAGADLTSSSFGGTCLRGADLHEARIDSSDLGKCDLREARLRGATLKGSTLIRADLRGADVTGANLMHALLGKARLEGANLTGANLFRADLSRIRADAATVLEGVFAVQARYVEPPPTWKVEAAPQPELGAAEPGAPADGGTEPGSVPPAAG